MSTPERFDSTTNLASSGNEDGSRSIFIVVLGSGILLSLVAIVLAAVAISRPPPSTTVKVVTLGGQSSSLVPASQTFTGGQKRIWTVAYGHDWGAYEYFDKEGYITGLSPEIVTAACKAAGMDCRLVWDRYTNCWQSKAGEHPRAGPGLMSRWYDACTAWSRTVDRVHTFGFSDPFFKINPTRFFVKKGNAAQFDGSDLKDRTIVFMDGWGNDEKCLARQQNSEDRKNYVLSKKNVLHAATRKDAIEALTNGTAYALLSDLRSFQEFSEVEVVPKIIFNCYLSGNSMMTRKDSDFNQYFNVGLQKIKSNGEFAKLCQEAKDKHGDRGEISCED